MEIPKTKEGRRSNETKEEVKDRGKKKGTIKNPLGDGWRKIKTGNDFRPD